MAYIFHYENYKAFQIMPPLHYECDDSAKDCYFPIKIISFKIGQGNTHGIELKREITADCLECKKRIKFWVCFD